MSLINLWGKGYISFGAMPLPLNVNNRGRFLVKQKGSVNYIVVHVLPKIKNYKYIALYRNY
jgi:hypothetical protein